MTEQDPQTSGSRWEPSTDTVQSTAEMQSAAPAETTAPTPRRLPGRLRRRVVTGVAAAALLVAGGVGGFAVAQATSDDATTVDSTTTDDDGDTRGDFPGGRPDFDGDVPPALGDGTAPRDGTDDESSTDSGDGTA